MRAPAATPITDEAAIRKKKIEALKAQAEDKARRLKEELEAKRAEAKAKEQRRMQAQVSFLCQADIYTVYKYNKPMYNYILHM